MYWEYLDLASSQDIPRRFGMRYSLLSFTLTVEPLEMPATEPTCSGVTFRFLNTMVITRNTVAITNAVPTAKSIGISGERRSSYSSSSSSS